MSSGAWIWIELGVSTCIGLAFIFALARVAGRGEIEHRILLRVFGAFFLILPVYHGLLAVLLSDLFLSIDPTWQIFTPWLNFLRLIGFQIGNNVRDLNILIYWTLLAISFPVAFPLGWIIERLFRLILSQRDATPRVDDYFA